MGNFTDDFPAFGSANDTVTLINTATNDLAVGVLPTTVIYSDDNPATFDHDVEARGGDIRIVNVSNQSPLLRFFQEDANAGAADTQRAQIGWNHGDTRLVLRSTSEIEFRTGAALPGTARMTIEDSEITLEEETTINGVLNVTDGLIMGNAILSTGEAPLGLGAAGMLIQAPIHIVDDNAVGTLRVSRVLNEADLVANQTISRIQMGRMEATGANPQNLGLITTQSTQAASNHPSNVGIHCLDTDDTLTKIIAITPDGIEFQETGDGIQFNQTSQSGTNLTVDSELMTRFEEGTGAVDFAGTITGETITIRISKYQIVGNWVHFNAEITWTAEGVADNDTDLFGIVLEDLPTADRDSTVSIGLRTGISLGSNRDVHARIPANSNIVRFYVYSEDGTETALTHNSLENDEDVVVTAGRLVMGGSYLI